MNFTYYDNRFGDTYVVFLTPEGEFSSALRYVDQVGRDAITYDFLYEIPQPHRNEIEHRIYSKSFLNGPSIS